VYEVREDVAPAGRHSSQVDVTGMTGPDAVAAGDGNRDGVGGDLAVGVGTVGFQEIVGATRVEGGIVVGEGGWSTAR
jgi:hypothetical protein